MFLEPTNDEEIYNVVSQLPLHKSRDHHDMNMYCIKYIIGSITKPLVHIYNLSFNAEVFPYEMKIAGVIYKNLYITYI